MILPSGCSAIAFMRERPVIRFQVGSILPFVFSRRSGTFFDAPTLKRPATAILPSASTIAARPGLTPDRVKPEALNELSSDPSLFGRATPGHDVPFTDAKSPTMIILPSNCNAGGPHRPYASS